MENDVGCEICVRLIMLQYFFFKTMHVRWLNSMLLPDGLEQFVRMLLYALFFLM